jgi:hypothetical protein
MSDSPRRRVRKRTIVIGLVILLVVAIVATLTMLTSDAGYELKLAEWEAAGGPRTLGELRPPPIPDDENAALHYTRAFRILEQMPEDAIQALWETDDATEIDQRLDAIPAELFEAILAATQLEACNWRTELYETGFYAPLPNLASMRSLNEILTADMLRRVRAGDDAGAVERLRAAMRMADHVRVDPVFISFLVGHVIEQRAIERWQRGYAEGGSIPREARPIFDRDDTTEQLRFVLFGEGVMVSESILTNPMIRVPGFLRQQEAGLYLSLMLDAINEIEKPFPEQDWDSIHERPPAWALNVREFLPSLSALSLRAAARDRLFVTMRASIALHEYRDEHGEYPDPDEWTMPIDPMTGDQLDYERTEDGITISAPAVNNQPGIRWKWK